MNIFKECSNTPSHGSSKRFYCETGVSHISWKDYCNKELLSNADNWYLTRNQRRERRRTSCPLTLKICLPSDTKWLQGIHKALMHLEVCY